VKCLKFLNKFQEAHSLVLWVVHNYIEWLQYLIENFISRWGYKLNGEVCWNGEDDVDSGILSVKDNVLTVTNTGNSTYWEDCE
jgi:hypothetical protein